MKNFSQLVKNLYQFFNGVVYNAIFILLFVFGYVLIDGGFSKSFQDIMFLSKHYNNISVIIVGCMIMYFLIFCIKPNTKSLFFSIGQDICYISIMLYTVFDAVLNKQFIYASIFTSLSILMIIFLFIGIQKSVLENNSKQNN